MDELAERTGRHYGLVDYHGAPDAERVVIVMGSAVGAVEETVDALVAAGEKVGMLKIRLFQPFPTDEILAALPSTVRSIAVLDRTKEPGAVGEPLYLEVVAAIAERMDSDNPPFATVPRIIGGRYGLSSKEVTPSMIKPIFDELSAERPKRHFTVGIYDDVTHLSLPIDTEFRRPPGGRGPGDVLRARLGRHRRRQQVVGQDHRRGHRPVRPGLLRLRLQEVGVGHRLAPAVRPRAHPVDLSRRGRRFRRLPPVRAAREDQGARVRQARGDIPAQCSLWTRRGLGSPSGRRPAVAPRQGDRLLGDRRARCRR